MKIESQTKTLAESMKHVKNPDDFSYALRNFLDRFYREPSSDLIYDEPDLLIDRFNDDGVADAYLASTAAWLAQSHDDVFYPRWADQKSRVCKKPWFAAKTPNLKAILLQESPAAFRVRNLFVSANALSRA